MKNYLISALVCALFFGCDQSTKKDNTSTSLKNEVTTTDEIFGEKLAELSENLYANLATKNYFITRKMKTIESENCSITSTLYIKFNLMPNDGSIEYYTHREYRELNYLGDNCKVEVEHPKRINIYADVDSLRESVIELAKIAHSNSDELDKLQIKVTVKTSTDGKYSLLANGKNVIEFDTNSITMHDSTFIKNTTLSSNENSFYDNLDTKLEVEDVTESSSRNPFVAILNIQATELNKYRN